jgi:hypothetical protein
MGKKGKRALPTGKMLDMPAPKRWRDREGGTQKERVRRWLLAGGY